MEKSGIVQETALFSNALNEEMTIMTYLPKTFSPLYKYTLLIAQDGQDYFRLGRISRQAEELMELSEIDNVIIVGIPYKNREERWEKYHPEGSQFSQYKRFLAHELVPFLDKEYPTYQVGQGRALIGDSLAATMGLMAGLEYPNIFGKVIMQSPLVDKHVLKAVTDFKGEPNLSIYHQIGTQEKNVPTTKGGKEDFTEPNKELQKLLEKRGFSYTFEEFEGDHTWTYWQPLLKKTLQAML
ncbi:esterase family protein [Metabacillus sp. GX 13764]|uniref:esterase family protein n=1 Tax=Metabacillus kandeliae TaxID=2900151 RepID=UPI001E36AB62|nr:esterase family protein [Metabacillus kandeliae]MCD7035014.1 esterase family protein [Metabacillus kandeliae]